MKVSKSVVLILISALLLNSALLSGQDNQKKPTPRKPLPKPATGSRGFEQAGPDSSKRLIAAGATRGPLRPTAPYEGLAYSPLPYFAWTPSPGATSYHFILRDGPESQSPIVFETDVKDGWFSYPSTAPALVPGTLYSWRVSTAGVMERKQGPSVTFFVLAGDDSTQVKRALEKGKLTAPKTSADKLRQAKVFEEFGVWYDAFRIASEIVHAEPNNTDAKQFYDSLIQRIREQAARFSAETQEATVALWHQLRTRNTLDEQARQAISRSPAAASLLYQNLLFESVASRVFSNVTLPSADQVRKALSTTNDETRNLEKKFDEWAKEKKFGVGFTKDSDGIEQIVYLAQLANLKRVNPSDTSLPPDSIKEIGERSLALAEANGIDFAISSNSAGIAIFAYRENRLADVEAPLARAEAIWIKWNHTVGLAQAPLVRGYVAYASEDWKTAGEFFAKSAELNKALPQLRASRVDALSMRATSLRNADDKEGVREALQIAVQEQEIVLKESVGDDERLKHSKTLASLQTQLGGALAAVGQHVQASEWWVKAERLRYENYRTERTSLEKQVKEMSDLWKTKIDAAKTEDMKKIMSKTLDTYIDATLTYLDSLATSRGDLAENARIANERLALARKSEDIEKIAHGLGQVGNAYRKAGELKKAQAAAEEALKLRNEDPRHRWIYETTYLLGQIADDADDWDKAAEYYRQVIAQTKPGVLPTVHDLDAEPDKELRTIKAGMNSFEQINRANKAFDARTALAQIQSRRGNYREADLEFNAILNDSTMLWATGAIDESELSAWLKSRGNTETKIGDLVTHRRLTGVQITPDEEQRTSFASIAIEALKTNVTSYRAMLYENQNDLDNAVKAYQRANNLNATLTGGVFALSGIHVALARIERERGNYAAAEEPIEAALAEAIRKNEAWAIANMLVLKSALRRDQGRNAEAKALAEDALRIARPLNYRSLTAGILRTLGKNESELGGDNLVASEQHLREALVIWRELGLRAHTAYTLDGLGLTLERQGRIDQAIAAYSEAVGIIETLIGSLSAGVSSETFNSSRANRDLYDHLIKLLIRQGRAAEAFQYLERAKSKSLVDALAGSNVNARDPALQALIDRVRNLGDAVRQADTALATEMQKAPEQRDAAVVAAAQARVAEMNRQYLDAVNQIQRTNPSYADLVAVNPIDLVEARKRLENRTVLLEYFPTDDELYIFVVTRNEGPVIRTVPIKRTDLAKLVMNYREALSSATEESVATRSASGSLWKDDGSAAFKADIAPLKDTTVKLYDALIKPVQSEVDASDRILIVPAGELYYLPFNGLGKLTADGSLSFLIETKSFAYFASADLLNAIAATTKASNSAHSKSSSTLLALGNPDGSLPAASTEVSQLGRLFSGSNVYTGKDATVSRVTTSGSSAAYLHFATHGFINSLEPKESYLLLAGTPDRLTVKDLVEDNYKLSFTGTRIVTLSACETNIGGYDPSAVYSSLSRAFSKAGAPTVVASLWSVNDVSTRETMTTFYKQLADGQSKGEAMRRAQLATMRDPRFAHPYYWAPFIILGDWR